MKKIFELYKKYREIINYLVVGVFGTVVSIATFTLFMALNIETVVSNVLSWVIVVILMYILNRLFVFKQTIKMELFVRLFRSSWHAFSL